MDLGDAVVALNGPWKFHTGDDPRWADPSFDDTAWETIDLTPPRGAHDSDVGLTGYVPGWHGRGHARYFGYAWYRLHLSVKAPPEQGLALCGPPYVDGAYQVFVNGRLLGGVGAFSTHPPGEYGIHKPSLFPLSQSLTWPGDSMLIAFRVYMGPWGLGSAESGGMHIAPSLGTAAGAQARYERQWLETFRGYIVDAVEALMFVLLAVMACSLIPVDRGNPAYFWLAGALVLLAAVRGNQAVMFWGEFETLHGFELVTIVLLTPLNLAAWTLTWTHWFRLRERSWIYPAIASLTLVYILSQFLRRSWFHGVFQPWVSTVSSYGVTVSRLAFVPLTLFILFRGLSQPGRERWFALPAVLLVSAGLFAQELSALHVPGIWFPFGTGVSRTEYAYAAFDVALFVLLLHRLYHIHPPAVIAAAAA